MVSRLKEKVEPKIRQKEMVCPLLARPHGALQIISLRLSLISFMMPLKNCVATENDLKALFKNEASNESLMLRP